MDEHLGGVGTEVEHAEPGAGFGAELGSGLVVTVLSGWWDEADCGFELGVVGAVAGVC